MTGDILLIRFPFSLALVHKILKQSPVNNQYINWELNALPFIVQFKHYDIGDDGKTPFDNTAVIKNV